MLVFGSLPTLPILSTDRPSKRLRLEALRKAREEMATIVAAQRLSRAFNGLLCHDARYTISRGDMVRIYRERIWSWEGPLIVQRISAKQACVQDHAGKLRQFNIVQILLESFSEDDRTLSEEHEVQNDLNQWTTSLIQE